MSILNKITPGEWYNDQHMIKSAGSPFRIGQSHVIDVPSPSNKFKIDTEGIANAAVFAASKDMLSIIERLAVITIFNSEDDEDIEELQKLQIDAKELLNQLNKEL